MDYNYDFPDKSFIGLTNFFEHNPTGENFVNYLSGNFSSVHQLLHHTDTEEGSSVVHLLTGDTLTFQNVPKKEFSSVVRAVGRYFGLPR